MMLSKLGSSLLGTPPPLVVAHFKCVTDPFDSVSNPGGYVNFGTAENHLLWDRLGAKLNGALRFPESVCHYDYLFGGDRFRRAIARCLERVSGGRGVDPEHIVIAGGSSSILDMMTVALCDPGDAVLLPAPYYSGFNVDWRRAGAVPVTAALSSRDRFALRVECLEKALSEARSQGRRVKMLLLTSPHNPLGDVYPERLLLELIDFSRREGLHCIVDEIYAHSTFGASRFTSVLALTDSPQVSVIYGFAKDFGLSGLKVGIGHSRDPQLIQVMRELCYFTPVSTLTQHALSQLLEDEPFLDDLFETNRLRLAEAHSLTAAKLRAAGIECHRPEAGIFAFVDLRAKLASATFEAEQALRSRIFDEAKVSLSPGGIFACPEPGWYRLCFAQPRATLEAGLERLVAFLRRPQ